MTDKRQPRTRKKKATSPPARILADEVTEPIEAGVVPHGTVGSAHLLSARLMQAQDAERRRMARDLHDVTGQELAVILMSLTRLSTAIGTPGFDANAEIAETVALTRKVENEIRTLSYALHPPMLDELGLRAALGWYVDGFSKRSKISVEMDIPSTLPRLSAVKEITLFRVIEESLANVERHAHSTKARIRANLQGKYVQLFVEDDGHGFRPPTSDGSKPDRVAQRIGILVMSERLRHLGGTLDIESTPAGTQVRARVPLREVGGDTSTEHAANETVGPAEGT